MSKLTVALSVNSFGGESAMRVLVRICGGPDADGQKVPSVLDRSWNVGDQTSAAHDRLPFFGVV